MKRFGIMLLSALVMTGLFNACSEEPPPPPHPIVGEWLLDGFIFGSVEASYDNFEGIQLSPQNLFGPDLNSYKVNFNNDNTYSRRLDWDGLDSNDAGDWEIQDDINLILSPDGEPFDDEFEIIGDIEETQMLLSQIFTFILLPNTVTDTLDQTAPYATQEWIDSVWDQYEGEAQVELWYIFER